MYMDAVLNPRLLYHDYSGIRVLKGVAKTQQGGARAGARIPSWSVDHFMITLHARLEGRPKPHARKTAQGWAQESLNAGAPIPEFRTTSI